MIMYLTNNDNFCLHGEVVEDYNITVDNNKTVDIDCLTWINKNSRIKVYKSGASELSLV